MSSLKKGEISKLDEQLAPKDFFDHLCLVKTSSVTLTDDIEPGNEVATYQLWPALKFNSFMDLQDQLKDIDGAAKIKGKLMLEFSKLRRSTTQKADTFGVAYLLGWHGGTSQSWLVFVPKNDKGKVEHDNHTVFEFVRHVEEMEKVEGYCGSEQFQAAYKLASRRMEQSLEMDDSSSSAPSPRPSPTKAKKADFKKDNGINAATMTTISSARKTTIMEIDYSPEMRRKKDMAEKKKQQTAATSLAVAGSSEEEKTIAPVETVEFPVNGGSFEESLSSPEKPTFSCDDQSETQSEMFSPKFDIRKSNRKSNRSTPGVERNLPWVDMHKQMKENGWTHIKGSSLAVEWYYLHPDCKGMKKTELLRDKVEGVDYVSSEKALQQYARYHLGWKGPAEVSSPKSPGDDAGMADRVKKRKRAATIVQQKKQETKAMVKTAKSTAKTAKVTRKQVDVTMTKKAVSNRAANSDTPGSESSAQSRFSDNSAAMLQISGSPTVREMEANVGVALGKKKKNTSRRLKFEPQDDASPSRPESSSSESSSSPGSESSSDQSSIDAAYQVMASSDAWLLLMQRFGFAYYRDNYCLPGKENRPSKGSSAVEGMDYFLSLEGLRKHLCAYGLPEVKKHIEEDEAYAMDMWVRYANVVGLGDAPKINPRDIGDINWAEAWRLLRKLGIKYTNAYLYPNSDPSKPDKRFESQQEFVTHLARFGIPHINGIQANEVLNKEDRLRLDLHIANTEVDSFERIDPKSDDINEITPRRTRRGRSNANESLNPELQKRSSASSAKPKKHFQTEFSKLECQREFPSHLLGSQEALKLLTGNYNISEAKSYYCLPGIILSEGEESMLGRDYFETIQDMRESLCAYGLPPIAKNSKLSVSRKKELEAWVRCANISALSSNDFDSIAVPELVELMPKNAMKVLRALGYTLSNNAHTYVLPGKSMHNSKLGRDRFEKTIDLINHIARFGLDTNIDSNMDISEEDKLYLDIFVAKVATFDLRNPDSNTTRKPITKQQSAPTKTVATSAKALPTTNSEAASATKSDLPVTPKNNLAVVVDEVQETPCQPSPQKKARPYTITKFLTGVVKKVGGAVASTLTPNRYTSEASSVDEKKDVKVEGNSSKPPELAAAVSESPPQNLSYPNTMKHLPQAESPNMPWSQLMIQMRASGLGYYPGDGLIAYYYVLPSVTKLSKRELLSQCDEGLHYFSSEKSLQRYALRHLGWVGDGGNYESSPIADLTSRVKKRTQANAALKSDTASPSKKPRPSRKKGNVATNASSSRSSKSNSSATSQSSSSSGKECIATVDRQPTVKEKLDMCQMVLHPSFKKNQLSKSTSLSIVSSKENDIKDFMTKSIETGTSIDGMTMPSPGFMYICGGPGTGKTTAVTSCADEMKKWAKKNGYDKPRFCLINMAASQVSSKSKDGVMRAMLKKIATAIEVDKEAEMSVFEKQFKKKVLVLVLDEVDMLFKEHGGVGEQFFRTLMGWAENQELRFSMIGISNCVNDTYSQRVRELAHAPRELIFSAYKEEDILAILEQRIGTNIVDRKALELISRKVAASSGDARRALEITSNAVGKSIDQLSTGKLSMNVLPDDEEVMPLVKLPHMMRAIREGMPMRHADVIAGLPQAAKVILCIAVSLSQVWGPTAEISISVLKKYCVEATHHAIMDEMGLGHVQNLVETLIDSGLLLTDNSGGSFNAHDVNAKLKIGVQLDDVEIALEESLLKEGGFYQSLVDYVKRECRDHNEY